MIHSYSRAYPDLWTGSLAGLKDDAFRLAVFLFTCQGVSPFGLYYKPLPTIAHETRRDPAWVREGMAELSKIDYCAYDETTGWVWVKQMAEYQFRPLPLKANNLMIRSVRRWYSALPRNPFMGAWWDRYHGEFRLDDPQAFPGSEIERREWVGRTLPAAPAAPPQLALLPPGPSPEPTTALERRKDMIAGEKEFELWWQHYPKKEGKAACLAKWKVKKIPAGNVPGMIEKLKQQTTWPKWREGYVPMPLTYLNQERWNDELEPTRTTYTKTNQRTATNLAELSREINPFDEDDHR